MQAVNALYISRFDSISHLRCVGVRCGREAVYANESSVHVVEHIGPDFSDGCSHTIVSDIIGNICMYPHRAIQTMSVGSSTWSTDVHYED